MKHVKAGLVALASLFFISSCIEKNVGLGSAMIPADQDISIQSACFDLPVSLRISDSLQTMVSRSATVGAVRTGTFGLFKSEAAMNISSYTDSVEWGNNPKPRRVYLSLLRDTCLVIDKPQISIPQNFYVHELTTMLDSSMAYNNSLGPKDYNPEVISITDVVYTGDESLTLELRKEFAEKFLRLPMSVRDSAELLMKEIPGLYIRCDLPEESLEGGRLNVFDLSSSSLVIDYDFDDDEGNHRTGSAVFSLGSHYSLNVCSSSADHLVSDNPAEAIYMEGLCGIKPHVSARELYSLLGDWCRTADIPMDRVLIAKATLEFPFEYGGSPDQFYSWPGNIFPCRREKGPNGRKTYSPLPQISDTNLESGNIDRSLLRYKSNISQYLQELLRRDISGITDDDDLWMMPTVSYTDSYSNTYYFPDYYFYKQMVLNGTAAERHPVLKITYTILR